MSDHDERDEGRDRGPLPLLYTGGAIAVTVAFIGFLTGTRAPEAVPLPGNAAATVAVDEGAVPAYGDMNATALGPNGKRYAEGLAGRGLPGINDKVVRNGDLDAVRAHRAGRRAFDGAPPTIPHAVEPGGMPACLACHDKGTRIGTKIAPAMSHHRYDNCTQCHVPAASPFDATPPPMLAENGWVGKQAPTTGTRAWDGAPPTISHGLWMRERCDSCHGVSGANPIRSTHPYRQSCQQCHVANSASSLDQPRLDQALSRWGGGPPAMRRR